MEINFKSKTIFENDKLFVMQGMNSECVDLIYLDPPHSIPRETMQLQRVQGRQALSLVIPGKWKDWVGDGLAYIWEDHGISSITNSS
ncbi:MAG: hypothetical protein OXB93_04695 [Cytophagales bacterium]|nr:hypothetical protein [Cytophagales bacterium]